MNKLQMIIAATAVACVAAPALANDAAPFAASFDVMDADANGLVTEGEFRSWHPNTHGKLFNMVDSTNDNQINFEEYVAVMPANMIGILDVDGNGEVDIVEFRKRMPNAGREDFAALDTDGDRKLTAVELDSFDSSTAHYMIEGSSY